MKDYVAEKVIGAKDTISDKTGEMVDSAKETAGNAKSSVVETGRGNQLV